MMVCNDAVIIMLMYLYIYACLCMCLESDCIVVYSMFCISKFCDYSLLWMLLMIAFVSMNLPKRVEQANPAYMYLVSSY